MHRVCTERRSSFLLVATLALVAVLATAGVHAVSAGNPSPTATPGFDFAFERYMGVLTETLKLTTAQQAKVRPIAQKYFDRRRTVRQQLLSEEKTDGKALRAEIVDLRNRENRELAKVLDPAQARKLEELHRKARGGGPEHSERTHPPNGPS